MDTTPRSTFALSLLPRPSSSPLPLSSSSSSSSTSFAAASSSSEAHADAGSALDPPLPPPPTALSAPSSHPPTHLFDQHPETTTGNVVDPSINTNTGSTSALQLLNISGTQLDDTLRSSSTPAPPQAITTSDSEDRIQSSRPPKRVRLSLEEDSSPSSPSSSLSVDPQSAISPDSQPSHSRMSRAYRGSSASSSHHTNGGGSSISNGHGNGASSMDIEAGPSSNGHSHHRHGSTRFSNGKDTNGSTSASLPPPETADYAGFRPLYEGSRVDRRELVRLTVQSLREMGYESSAKSLEAEAGVILEHPSITAFRSAVLDGDWRNAERLLIDGLTYAAARKAPGSKDSVVAGSHTASTSASSNGASSYSTAADLDIVLRDPGSQSLDSIRFLLQQQRYLELVEGGHTKKALSVLRDRLTPLSHGSDRLHLLSSLVMSSSPEELKSRAQWAGTGELSRRKLLEDIEFAVSPNVMLPSRRLPHLLEQAQMHQKQLDPFFNLPSSSHISLYTDHRSDRTIFPSTTTHILRGHEDQVWVMAFSHDGRWLATGGKDKVVIVWSITSERCEMVTKLGPHSHEVSTVAWSPDDATLLVASDTDVYQWQWRTSEQSVIRRAHKYTIYAAEWHPSGDSFVTAGMDGDITWWSLGKQRIAECRTWPSRVLALRFTPDGRYLVGVSWRSAPLKQGGQSASISSSTTTGGNGGLARLSAGHRGSASTNRSSQNSWSPSESPSPVHIFRTSTDSGAASGSQSSQPGVIGVGGGSRTFNEDQRGALHFWGVPSTLSAAGSSEPAKLTDLGTIYTEQEMVSLYPSIDSQHILVNRRPNELQLWDIHEQQLVRTFQAGHRMEQDMIRCCFGGNEDNFVATGSEDGAVYVYHRGTGKMLGRLVGHDEREGQRSVNAVAWHPRLCSLLASCGDDGTIRIWQPEAVAAAVSSAGGDVDYSGGRDRANTSFNAASTGPMPFPWSMSPMRPSSPEDPEAAAAAAGEGPHATSLVARMHAQRASRMAAGGASSSSGAGSGGLVGDDAEMAENDEGEDEDEEDEDDDEEDEDEELEEEEEDEDDEEDDVEEDIEEDVEVPGIL
ncbi:WD40 repeat-like protein [Jaminaea rosea]|uniref:WD40 repeat-like protein n=1 Tax=Jaminaea rosea TaxID=1569628 RepID=A0A316UL34_9BASI|nr:WD40 repeat-like protein [Jaminaea rosea]PWN25950.1 WD40 repeat-like protein [Jaminaea rosea]